jgi:hypothetical protein
MSVLPQVRASSSKFSKMRSRPQTAFDEGIQEIDEKLSQLNGDLLPHRESPTDLNKIKIDITHVDVKIKKIWFMC